MAEFLLFDLFGASQSWLEYAYLEFGWNFLVAPHNNFIVSDT